MRFIIWVRSGQVKQKQIILFENMAYTKTDFEISLSDSSPAGVICLAYPSISHISNHPHTDI